MAVGTAAYSNAVTGYAERLAGSTWTLESVPAPPGTEASYLEKVSCPSSKSCTAVGNAKTKPSTWVPLVSRWNGKVWASEEAKLPAEAKRGSFTSISCATSTTCVAAGDWEKGKRYSLSEEWNGSTWRILPSPAGGEEDVLEGISCASATACTAVSGSVAEHWNGKAWTMEVGGSLEEAYLRGVSCATTTLCTATGDGASGPIAERWEGGTWKTIPAARTGASREVHLWAIDCPSTSSCVSAGSFQAEILGPHYTLAEVY